MVKFMFLFYAGFYITLGIGYYADPKKSEFEVVAVIAKAILSTGVLVFIVFGEVDHIPVGLLAAIFLFLSTSAVADVLENNDKKTDEGEPDSQFPPKVLGKENEEFIKRWKK